MEDNQEPMATNGKNMYMKMDNGNKFFFWKDGSIDQTSLRELFPDLFLIYENPDARVSDCWTI